MRETPVLLVATISRLCCFTPGTCRLASVVRRLSHPFRDFPIGARRCLRSMLLLRAKACRMTLYWGQKGQRSPILGRKTLKMAQKRPFSHDNSKSPQ